MVMFLVARDISEGMKTFLVFAQKGDLTGKMGGAFDSYTHSGESAQMIYDTLQHVIKQRWLIWGL